MTGNLGQYIATHQSGLTVSQSSAVSSLLSTIAVKIMYKYNIMLNLLIEIYMALVIT